MVGITNALEDVSMKETNHSQEFAARSLEYNVERFPDQAQTTTHPAGKPKK